MIKVKYSPVTWLKCRIRIALYKGEVLFQKFAVLYVYVQLPSIFKYLCDAVTNRLGSHFFRLATIHMLVQAHLHVVLSSSELMTNKSLSFPPGLVPIA